MNYNMDLIIKRTKQW